MVITADDFGLASGINRGISDCVESGNVCAVSVSVNGRAFEEAAKFIKDRRFLSVGLHITLVGEKSLLAGADIGSLSSDDGRLPDNYLIFLLKYFSRRIKISDIEKEIRAQFRKLNDSGVVITHVNSHQHLHIIPGILDIVIGICQEYGVNFIRCPYARPGRHWLSARADKAICQFILNIFCRFAAVKIKSAGINVCDNTSGILFSGRLRFSEIRMLLGSFKEGLCELICHPACSDKELVSLYGYWDYAWAEEHRALCRNELEVLLNKEGFSPGSLSARKDN